jgi:antitoxin component of RelBE/YafQ-DinJ toxin-antitoxin module
VQDVWDEAHDAVVKAAAKGTAVTMPITRSDVVRTLISADLLAQVAKQQSVTLPADLSLDEYASSLHVPADTEFVKLYAQADGYVKALREGAKNAPAASDADLQEVYDVLAANGQVEGYTFDQFKQSLPDSNKQLVQTASAVRKEIAQVTDGLDITVNPRYQPLGIAVLQFQTQNGEVRPLVSVPLGSDETVPVSAAS